MEAIFTAHVQTGPGAHPASCTMGTGSFPGGKKRPGRDVDPSPPSSAVGHKRVELYLYSPYGPYGLYRASVPVQGCTLLSVSRDSSFGIATRYGLDGPGIESLWGRDFPHPSRPSLEPTHNEYCGAEPNLAPTLKKEYIHTSTPRLGLRGLLYGDLYLYR